MRSIDIYRYLILGPESVPSEVDRDGPKMASMSPVSVSYLYPVEDGPDGPESVPSEVDRDGPEIDGSEIAPI